MAYRHRIDAADLVPDARARALFVDALEAPDGTVATIGDYALAGDSAPRPCAHFRATRAGAAIDKRVALRDERVHVAYALAGGLAGRWRVEMDLAMPSCDGVGGRFIHDGAIRGGFGDTHAIDATDHVRLDDTFMGGGVDLRCSPRARVDARPYRTVSQSEQGFEKIMQSITLTLSWPLDGGPVAIDVSLAIARRDA